MRALAAAHYGGEYLEAGTRRQLGDLLYNLLRRLGVDLAPALGAMRCPHPGIENPQVVIDLGNRAHRGSGILAHRLLFDGDGRTEAADEIHFRLFHLTQELPGVGGKRLDITPLALGIERVERQAAFPAAGHTRDNHQLVPRNGQIYVLQIVLLRTTNDQFV